MATSVAELRAVETEVLTAINGHRRRRGLSPLESRPEIAEQARRHSEAMAGGRARFGHGGFRDRVRALAPGIEAGAAAENVSRHDRRRAEVAAAALAAWLASPTHRRNLEGDYALTGIGAARSADGTWYLTQLFVRP